MSTAELVKIWWQYRAESGDPSIVRAIEMELFHRPVKERWLAGYPK